MGRKSNRTDSSVSEIADTNDILSEHHTIVGSVGDNSSFTWDEEANMSWDTDELIRNGGDHVEAAEAAARDSARRLQLLTESLTLLCNISYEKRAVVRERILKQNFVNLANTPRGWEVVVPVLNSIQASCRSSFQRGTPAEQYASCRVLEVISILLGSNEEEFVDTIDHLRSRAATKETAVRRAAMRTYATAILVCATGDVSLRNTALDWYESLLLVTDDTDHHSTNAIPDVLKATAWDCWCLLALLLADDDIAGEQEGRGPILLEAMLQGLDSRTPELRSAAGQAATLVHEARLSCGQDEGNVTARQFQRGSWEGSAYEDMMDEIQQRVSDLAVESSHHVGRKVKKARRATFREYAATLLENESPEEVVHFRHGSLEITTWKHLIVLNHLRQCLQGGFQVQLLTNPTIQSMIGVERTMIVAGGLSSEEKRLVQSNTSEAVKTADQDRRSKRDKRENVKNHFLTVDDE